MSNEYIVAYTTTRNVLQFTRFKDKVKAEEFARERNEFSSTAIFTGKNMDISFYFENEYNKEKPNE